MRIAISLLVVFLYSSTQVNAQFEKGTRMVGFSIGSAFFNSGKSDFSVPSPTTSGFTSNTNSFALNFTPNIGWFISPDLAIGGRIVLGYDYDKNIDAANNITFRKDVEKAFNVSLGAFARKYFNSTGFMPFAQLNIDAGTGSSKKDGFYYTTSYKETYTGKSSGDFNYDAGLSLGLTKMLSTTVGLDIIAGYLYSSNKNKFKTTTQKDIDYNGSIDEEGVTDLSTKTSNHGFNIGVGLQVFFGRKK